MTRNLIVLGDDGSSGADGAWRWTMQHRWPGWDLDVLTATASPDPVRFAASDEPATEWRSPFPRSLDPASELGTVRFLTKTGDPRAVLNDRVDASLLAVGAAGLGSFTSVLLGSTADWLLHQPVAPVAVIRDAARTRRVLCCVDGSEHAQCAIEAIASLPWVTSCHARILSVDDGRTDTDAAIHAARSALTTAGVETSTLVLSGRPTRSILTHIDTDEEPIDLVVIGTRGLTTLRRLWVGSTAAAVARHCRTNVLVASAQRGAAATATPSDGGSVVRS